MAGPRVRARLYSERMNKDVRVESEDSGALSRFSLPTRTWFTESFSAPTAAQAGAWEAISQGRNTLVIAPTGSGKTLSAFLHAIDRLANEDSSTAGAAANAPADSPAPGVRVLYISPLKALGVDVERNLRSPLAGIVRTSERLDLPSPHITVGVRSGDTPPSQRRAIITHPPDILITTPESLYLLLTSSGSKILRGVQTVIIDEIHALASSKRGSHLALSLERLDAGLVDPAQRIGLSATVRPADRIAHFLGGSTDVAVVAPDSQKRYDLHVDVPVPDMNDLPEPPHRPVADSSEQAGDSGAEPGSAGDGPTATGDASFATGTDEHRRGSLWPFVEESLYQRILDHRSTIVFTNSRRVAERLANTLNDMNEARTGEPGTLARAHHGSVAKEQREIVEESLKSGTLRCVVATSSLELGIDMGDVDLVIQIDSPPSVASALQRIGRAGHHVGEVSKAITYPLHRGAVLTSAAVFERALHGQIETIHIPANPLDVLAQQTVAAAAMGELNVEDWFETVRRAAPFRTLPRSAYEGTLDLLTGKYPSSEFAHLRPRLVWDRIEGTLTARPGAARLAITNGGTIPDRGLFRVYAVGEGESDTRVGELDEEMVYESRVGDVFTLGATSWRIREITNDRVNVVPAFGEPGRMPFWRGESAPRPPELGQALAHLISDLDADLHDGKAGRKRAESRLHDAGLDDFAVDNALNHIIEQAAATTTVPGSRGLVIERLKDDLGDWQVVLHSPYGQAINAPWALAINARVREEYGLDNAATAENDGIIVRIPDADREPPGASLFLFDPAEARAIVQSEITASALFAGRFREAAARALVLGGGQPGKRSPLWQQRQRSGRLLELAASYPDFPITLEAARESLRDVYAVDDLEKLLADLGNGTMRLTEVTTELPSPFARSLLFGYVGEFIYEGDAPLGERRLAALSLDPALLRELLGDVAMRELLDADAVAEVSAELQRTAPHRRLAGTEGMADLLRLLGPLSVEELAQRLEGEAPPSGPDEPADTAPASAAPASANATDLESDEALAVQKEDAPLPSAAIEQVEDHLATLSRSHRVIEVRIAQRRTFAAVEDAGVLQAALGTALPVGVPVAFTSAPPEPLKGLLLRFAATHGPFTSRDAAAQYGLGEAVVTAELQRISQSGTVSRGAFRPDSAGDDEWVHREVLKKLRARSLAKLRGSIEPVAPRVYSTFLARWQQCDGSLRGVDGVRSVIEQLSGLPLPASALETLILPARVRDYTPDLLDSLLASGEVLWVGEGTLPGNDGRISLHVSDSFDLTAPREPTPISENNGDEPTDAAAVVAEDRAADSADARPASPASSAASAPSAAPTPTDEPPPPIAPAVLLALRTHGALFVPALRAALKDSGVSVSETALIETLWDLAFAGRITSDSFAPARKRVAGGSAAQKTKKQQPRTTTHRRSSFAALRQAHRGATDTATVHGDAAAGRWSLVPYPTTRDEAVTATTRAALLLDRYGVVTRGAVTAESYPGGFAAAYSVLKELEQAGHCRRGYIIDGLGGAQFADPHTIDDLRELADQVDAHSSNRKPRALTLSAADPANPFGASLPWPDRGEPDHADARRTAAGPKRNPGALVVIIDGQPVLYVERGGRTGWTFGETDLPAQRAAAASLVETVQRAHLRTFTLEKLDGERADASNWHDVLIEAGFAQSPRGLILRQDVR